MIHFRGGGGGVRLLGSQWWRYLSIRLTKHNQFVKSNVTPIVAFGNQAASLLYFLFASNSQILKLQLQPL